MELIFIASLRSLAPPVICSPALAAARLSACASVANQAGVACPKIFGVMRLCNGPPPCPPPIDPAKSSGAGDTIGGGVFTFLIDYCRTKRTHFSLRSTVSTIQPASIQGIVSTYVPCFWFPHHPRSSYAGAGR